MKFRVGLENNYEGRSLAWALEHPGCFAYGPDGKGAIIAMAQAVPAYIHWMEKHTSNPWLRPDTIKIDLVDVWDVYQIDRTFERADDGYDVNAWFLHDWKPLTEIDIERGLQLLAWTRQDLNYILSDVTDEHLDEERPGERWSIRGIVNHIGTAEWWYLSRLRLTTIAKDELPKDVFDRIDLVRRETNRVLPHLAGVVQAIGKDGEFWSPRKVLRRAVGHEMDHIMHIHSLLVRGARR